MKCDYCSKELNRHAFCSEAHKKRYYRQKQSVPQEDEVIEEIVPERDAEDITYSNDVPDKDAFND